MKWWIRYIALSTIYSGVIFLGGMFISAFAQWDLSACSPANWGIQYRFLIATLMVVIGPMIASELLD